MRKQTLHICRKYLCLGLVALVMAVVFLPCCSIVVAVAYSGSGTKKDPYLVQTAEQLDGIRNKLSAHYKLANTIDLSAWGDFSPIGHLDRPFTGSFVCDTDASGKALYAIKNLKINLPDKTYTDYVGLKLSKWECGLFGVSSGAEFKHIYLLDVNIYSGIEGMNTGSKAYNNFHPGQDEMGTGALVGMARYNTMVLGCISTGKMKSRSNHTGGLIGNFTSGTISNCMSSVDIESTGNWNVGGLIGATSTTYLDDGESQITTITNCYATGNIKGSCVYGGLKGGFLGASKATTTITNCYSTGKLQHNMANNFIGVCDPNTVVTNCYTTTDHTGVKGDDNAAPIATENCYVLNSLSKITQQGFKKASAQEILKGFSGLKGWITTGVSLPVLDGFPAVNAADFKPGAVTTPPESSSTQTGAENNQSDPLQSTPTVAEGDGAPVTAEALTALIDEIPEASAVKLADKEKIKKADALFNQLSEEQYGKMEAEKIAKLNDCKNALCKLLVGDIVQKTEKLPEVKKLTAADKPAVLELYDDYMFLTDEYKNAFDDTIKDKILNAYEAVRDMQESVSQYRDLTTAEKTISGVLIALIVLTVGLNVVMSILVIKKIKARKTEETLNEPYTEE